MGGGAVRRNPSPGTMGCAALHPSYPSMACFPVVPFRAFRVFRGYYAVSNKQASSGLLPEQQTLGCVLLRLQASGALDHGLRRDLTNHFLCF
ncbi:hypothetical protein TspCOW1_11830 [Thiohalobacter sp. COW1]|nr:hypothetical protein TspCOW1_11830 [Thiohalobacter sp. COW1]